MAESAGWPLSRSDPSHAGLAGRAVQTQADSDTRPGV